MTILEGINEIREGIRIHKLTDMATLDNRLILTWMNDQRALWLKNEINKGRSIEDNVKQYIDGLELEVVDGSTFDLINTKYRILRTKSYIPKTVELLYSDTLLTIRNSVIFSKPYNYITRDQVPYVGSGRFNKGDIYVFLYDARLHILIPKDNPKIALLTHISIEGVFENPVEVYELYGRSKELNYLVLNEEYPIGKAMWTYIKGVITELNVKQFINKEIEDGKSNNI